MEQRELLALLKRVERGEERAEDAYRALRLCPFEDLGYAKVDHHRALRQGAGEVIYGAGKTQEQQKTEDTAKKQAYGKEQRKRRAEVRARLKKVESEIEELGAHIVELENEINDPEVLRDHLLLRDKCDELDDTRFHQQELYDEWEKLAEEQETFENEGE